MRREDRFTVAAARLEELSIYMKTIIKMLREEGPHEYNGEMYAQVYELRCEIGYVVRTLGSGTCSPSTRDWYADTSDTDVVV